jgi:iron complex transport system permease protein
MSAGQALHILVHPILGGEETWSQTMETVVWRVRFPRITGAILVGAALASAGAAYQTIFRNPLVSPAILGVSQGAAFGSSLGLLLRLSWTAVQLLGIAFGLLATVVAVLIGRQLGRGSTVTLVLGGVVVTSIFGALISMLQYAADPLDTLPSITFWLMGSLARVGNRDLLFASGPLAVSFALLYAMRWQINVLGVGQHEAAALGMNEGRIRALVVTAATVMTALAVSISGIVGWVGLVIPHIARMLVGPNFDRLLPVSALLGGTFLLAVDTVARSSTTVEYPLGVLTALIGAPFFVLILAQAKRQWI